MRLVRSGGLHDPLRAAARRLKRSGDRNCSSERGWTRPAIRKRVRGHDGDLFATVQLSLGARRYPRAATQESSSFQESEIFSWRPRYSDWPGVSHGVRHDLALELFKRCDGDRKRVVEGKRVSLRVDFGGCRI